jgi:hypothetical protein
MTTRSEISINEMKGGFAAAETADAIDKTNDHVLDVSGFKRVILAFHISAATAADTITVKAGTGEPAFRRALGDLVYSCAGGAAEVVLGPLETARFVQPDGTILIDVAGSTIDGYVEAYGL